MLRRILAAMSTRERTVWPDRRHDFRWDADRTTGFEKATFLYDAEGRLIAVDYSSPSRATTPSERETPRSDHAPRPAPPQS